MNTRNDAYITPSKLTIIGLDKINPNNIIHYLVYKITFKTNDFYYIGQHKTTQPLDNYTGSGILVKLYKEKYGLTNMIKEILFDFNSHDQMDKMEHDLIPVDINGNHDILCLNLIEGGHSCKQTLAMRKHLSELWNKKSLEEKQRIKNVIVQKNKEYWNNKTDVELKDWQEFCRQKNIGENNPMYGVSLSSCMDPVKYSNFIENNRKRLKKLNKKTAKKRKGKTLEEIYGKDKAIEIKAKISATQTRKSGRNIKQFMSKEKIKQWKKNLSIATSGKNNPAYNRKWIYNKLTFERLYIHIDELSKYIFDNSNWILGIPKNKSYKSGMTFAINRLKKKYPNVDFSKFDYSKYQPSIGKSRYKYLDEYIELHRQ